MPRRTRWFDPNVPAQSREGPHRNQSAKVKKQSLGSAVYLKLEDRLPLIIAVGLEMRSVEVKLGRVEVGRSSKLYVRYHQRKRMFP